MYQPNANRYSKEIKGGEKKKIKKEIKKLYQIFTYLQDWLEYLNHSFLNDVLILQFELVLKRKQRDFLLIKKKIINLLTNINFLLLFGHITR